jgi:predicted acetyltransferase
MGKKNKKDSAAKAKKEARKAEQAKLQEQSRLLKEARAANPLDALPPMFTAFKRNGVDAAFEHATLATLSTEDRLTMRAILESNVSSESELKAEKAKLTEENARLLVLRSAATAAASPASSPTSSPAKDAAAAPVAEGAAQPEEEPQAEVQTPTKPVRAAAAGEVLAYMNFRYEFLHDSLIFSIGELQVADREDARRKGVGKMMLMLAEMCAKKAGMGGVMLTVNRANVGAVAFLEACKYTTDSISPCKVDPSADADAYGAHNYSQPRHSFAPRLSYAGRSDAAISCLCA